jgi:hypothetical protein
MLGTPPPHPRSPPPPPPSPCARAVKVLTFLTMPLDKQSANPAQQADLVGRTKEAVAGGEALAVVVSLLADPLAK